MPSRRDKFWNLYINLFPKTYTILSLFLTMSSALEVISDHSLTSSQAFSFFIYFLAGTLVTFYVSIRRKSNQDFEEWWTSNPEYSKIIDELEEHEQEYEQQSSFITYRQQNLRSAETDEESLVAEDIS